MPGVIGWDVGGVNTKIARVLGGEVRELRSCPFEIQRAPRELAPLVARLAREIGSGQGDHHAVTMTAELSQHFLTKREGVRFVLDSFESALPESVIQVYGTDGAFRTLEEARGKPLLAAASNWLATASFVAFRCSEAVLVDIGTTTTDIIPIRGGSVAARGRTDPDRLGTGELLYLGALRTPVEAIVHEVPLGGSMAGVSAESFALAGDVYVWLGELAEDDYTVPTPDGRAATRAGARDRLARVVCADRELLDDRDIDAVARHVASVHAERVARSLERVIAHHPSISTVVIAGLGSFIARRAAGLVRPAPLAVAELGAGFTPAAAVALLLERQLGRPLHGRPLHGRPLPDRPLPDRPLSDRRFSDPPLSDGPLSDGSLSDIIPASSVIPAKAGIQVGSSNVDSRLRGDDERIPPRSRRDDAAETPSTPGSDRGSSRDGGLERHPARGPAMHDARPDPDSDPSPDPGSAVRTVIKVGGALLGRQGALHIVVETLARVAERGDPVLIVPGGGPFADAVRRIDTEIGLPADTAHWMAILALDQYAELLASRIPASRVVRDPGEAAAALAAGELPILAPSGWLRSSDPLPHSWDVTSDSIAAWVAGEVGAERLVLAKAARSDLSTLVDPHFARVLPAGVEALIVEPGELADALGVSRHPPV